MHQRTQRLFVLFGMCTALFGFVYTTVETPYYGVSLPAQVLDAPNIVSVTSPKADGLYGLDEEMSIVLNFSDPVFVDGQPLLTLNAGPNAVAEYISGTGTPHLIFRYVVKTGQSTEGLDIASSTALALNGGRIFRADNANAELRLPEPGSAESLATDRTIEIDTLPPILPGIVSPLEGEEIGGTVVTMLGTAEAGAFVSVQRGDAILATTLADGSGSWRVTLPELPIGAHTMSVRSRDTIGNESTAAWRQFLIVPVREALLTLEPESKSFVATSPYNPDQAVSCPLYRQITSTLSTDASVYTTESGALIVPVGGRQILYSDVTAGVWFSESLIRLSSTYMVSGESAGSAVRIDDRIVPTRLFHPHRSITYGELAKMISLSAGIRPVVNHAQNLSAWNHWSEKYIARLERADISQFGTMPVDGKVTRGAFLQAVVEVFKIPTENLQKTLYKDLYESHRFADAINAATRIGLVYGDTDSRGKFLRTIRPNDEISRSEAIAILDRTLRIVCQLERAAQVLPNKEGPYGLFSNNSHGLDISSPLPGPAPTTYYPYEPMCTRLARANESAIQTQSGQLLMTHSGTTALVRDVSVRASYAVPIARLIQAEVFEGTGKRAGVYIDSTYIPEEELQSGPLLLGSSPEDEEIKKRRKLLYEKYALGQGEPPLPVTEFGVADILSFGAMAKILTLAADVPLTYSLPFNETAHNHWSAKFVAAMERLGVSDFLNGGMPVEQPITRGQFVNVMLEALELPFDRMPREGYSDLYPSHRYYPALMSATAMNFIRSDTARNGIDLKTIRPNDYMTRAESAEILYRTVKWLCSQ